MKKVLIVLLIIVALPFIVALFVAKEYAVEREIDINRSKSEVFDYVKHLKNQDVYSKWSNMDPDMKKTYTGEDGKVGFVSGWSSEKEDVGVGEQEITNIVDGQRVEFELRFLEPFEATDDAYMITESVSEDQTKVKWGFTGKMDYPKNLLLLVMDFEGMIGDDLATGLSNLKAELEK